MLTHIRKKILQQNIREYSELRVSEWWNFDIISYTQKQLIFGKQRCSKDQIKKSFENSTKNIFFPYQIAGKIYNMIPCLCGSFIKGSNLKGHDNPIGTMKIEKPFLLGETEITQEIYEAVMGKNPSVSKTNPNNPVDSVSWYDAVMFCNKLSDLFELYPYYHIFFDHSETLNNTQGHEATYYFVDRNKYANGFRLPTEWEWEYAAKAGTELLYSGSNNINEVAWHHTNSNYETHPVKQKKPNAWGFYDMTGNVAEWCDNKYDLTEKEINAFRILRGGSVDYKSNRSSFRQAEDPTLSSSYFGFRICKNI